MPEVKRRRAAELFASMPWLCSPDYYHLLFDIVSGRNDASDYIHLLAEGQADQADELTAALIGEPLPGANEATVTRDGICIIPIMNGMHSHASSLRAVSGSPTSYRTIQHDLKTALESDAVNRIVLDIDSPGGDVSGIEDLTEAIFLARTEKPLHAYVSGQAASAAFWIATAATSITMNTSAAVGSLGVVCGAIDWDAQDAADGIRTIEVVSDISPEKRQEFGSDEQFTTLLARANDIAKVFVAAVARNRGKDAAHVIEHFGRGGMVSGPAAMSACMADHLGTLDQLLATLTPARLGRGLGAAAATWAPEGQAVLVPYAEWLADSQPPAWSRTDLVPPGPEVDSTRRSAKTKAHTEGTPPTGLTPPTISDPHPEEASMPASIESLTTEHPELVAQIKALASAEGYTKGHTAGHTEGLANGLTLGKEQGRQTGMEAERTRATAIVAEAAARQVSEHAAAVIQSGVSLEVANQQLDQHRATQNLLESPNTSALGSPEAPGTPTGPDTFEAAFQANVDAGQTQAKALATARRAHPDLYKDYLARQQTG